MRPRCWLAAPLMLTLALACSDDDTGQVAMWTELLTPVVKEMIFYPEGDTSGDIKWTGNAFITNHSLTSSTNSMVTMSISFQGSGAIAKAAVS